MHFAPNVNAIVVSALINPIDYKNLISPNMSHLIHLDP